MIRKLDIGFRKRSRSNNKLAWGERFKDKSFRYTVLKLGLKPDLETGLKPDVETLLETLLETVLETPHSTGEKASWQVNLP